MNWPFPHLLLAGLACLAGPLAGQLAEPTPVTEPQTLEFSQALALALARNYTIRVDRYSPQLAEQDLRGAKAQFDPTLSARYFRTEDSGPVYDVFGGETGAQTTNFDEAQLALEGLTPLGTRYRAGLRATETRNTEGFRQNPYAGTAFVELTQPLLKGLGADAQMLRIRVARNQVAASEWALRATLSEVVTQTINAYADTYFLQENLAIARRSRDLAAQLLAENRRRVEVGSMAPIDTVVAEAELAIREERLILAESQLHAQLNVLKGLLADRTVPVLGWQPQLAPPPALDVTSPDVTRDYGVALTRRPDYQQAELGLNTRDLELRAARNADRPGLDFVASYGRDGFGTTHRQSLDGLRRSDYDTTSAGLVLTLPLGRRESRATEATAHLRRQREELSLEHLGHRILLELDTAAFNLAQSARRLEAARTARELSERGLAAEERKLQLGTSTTFVVLRLQGDLALAEIRELSALTDYRQAQAQYELARGTTLETFQIELAGE